MSKLDPEMYNRMQEYMYSEEGQRNYEAQEKREQEEQKRREENEKAYNSINGCVVMIRQQFADVFHLLRQIETLSKKTVESNNKAVTLEQIAKLFSDVELCSNNMSSITNALKTLDVIQNSIIHCRLAVTNELIKLKSKKSL